MPSLPILPWIPSMGCPAASNATTGATTLFTPRETLSPWAIVPNHPFSPPGRGEPGPGSAAGPVGVRHPGLGLSCSPPWGWFERPPAFQAPPPRRTVRRALGRPPVLGMVLGLLEASLE